MMPFPRIVIWLLLVFLFCVLRPDPKILMHCCYSHLWTMVSEHTMSQNYSVPRSESEKRDRQRNQETMKVVSSGRKGRSPYKRRSSRKQRKRGKSRSKSKSKSKSPRKTKKSKSPKKRSKSPKKRAKSKSKSPSKSRSRSRPRASAVAAPRTHLVASMGGRIVLELPINKTEIKEIQSPGNTPAVRYRYQMIERLMNHFYIFVIIDDRISIFKHRRRCTLSLRTVPGRAREMMIRIASTWLERMHDDWIGIPCFFYS